MTFCTAETRKLKNYISQPLLQLGLWMWLKFYQSDALIRNLEGRREGKLHLGCFYWQALSWRCSDFLQRHLQKSLCLITGFIGIKKKGTRHPFYHTGCGRCSLVLEPTVVTTDYWRRWLLADGYFLRVADSWSCSGSKGVRQTAKNYSFPILQAPF